MSQDTLEKVAQKLSADVLVYSGEIDVRGADKIIDLTAAPRNENVLLILCTPGGCPNSAFKIARRLQSKYKTFFLYVYGYCKSAGTIVAVGSDKIVMSDYAEFGPLDVQLQEKDEIARYSSGLNIDEALLNLKEETRKFFRQTLLELTTGAGISTKTAAELALSLSGNFYTPIVSQIDPMRVGEIRRAVKIAMAYGERLISDGRGNLKSVKELARLVESYPDHGFVIDFKEAQTIFNDIRKEDAEEGTLGKALSSIIRSPRPDRSVIELLFPKEKKDAVQEISDKPTGARGAGKNKAGKGKTNTGTGGTVLPIRPNGGAAA